jgi:hypothetical protein
MYVSSADELEHFLKMKHLTVTTKQAESKLLFVLIPEMFIHPNDHCLWFRVFSCGWKI